MWCPAEPDRFKSFRSGGIPYLLSSISSLLSQSGPVVSGNPSMMFMFWTAAPACHPGRLPRQGRGRLTFQRPQGASGAGAGQSSRPVVSGNPSIMFMFCTAAPACHPGRLPRQGRGRLTFQRPQGASGAGAGQSSSPVVSGNPSMMFLFWTAGAGLSSRPVAPPGARPADITTPPRGLRRRGRSVQQSCGLRQSQHDVHVLDRGAGGPFPQVVEEGRDGERLVVPRHHQGQVVFPRPSRRRRACRPGPRRPTGPRGPAALRHSGPRRPARPHAVWPRPGADLCAGARWWPCPCSSRPQWD